jgi:hypothetical protein
MHAAGQQLRSVAVSEVVKANARQVLFAGDTRRALADEMEDGQTGFLIERAIDEARSRQFRPMG